MVFNDSSEKAGFGKNQRLEPVHQQTHRHRMNFAGLSLQKALGESLFRYRIPFVRCFSSYFSSDFVGSSRGLRRKIGGDSGTFVGGSAVGGEDLGSDVFRDLLSGKDGLYISVGKSQPFFIRFSAEAVGGNWRELFE